MNTHGRVCYCSYSNSRFIGICTAEVPHILKLSITALQTSLQFTHSGLTVKWQAALVIEIGGAGWVLTGEETIFYHSYKVRKWTLLSFKCSLKLTLTTAPSHIVILDYFCITTESDIPYITSFPSDCSSWFWLFSAAWSLPVWPASRNPFYLIHFPNSLH